MIQKIYWGAAAALLYFLWFRYAGDLFVFPAPVIQLDAFLPPIWGLMLGPAGALGVALGSLAAHLTAPDLRETATVFLAAYLPYKLWHTIMLNESKTLFAFNRTTLRKFVLVIFLTFVATSLFQGLTMSQEEIAARLAQVDFAVDSRWKYIGLLFLNDFDVAIFFGMPFFFLLIGYQYNFYLPHASPSSSSKKSFEMNRFALIIIHGFFLGLFLLLDVSGVIFDLDRMDTWLSFNGELLTTMNLTLLVLLHMLVKYRHSIMTNLMMMQLATMFIAAFLLGSISFLALSRAIDVHVKNDLEKMSVIYRERLANTFSRAIAIGNNMARLATRDMENEQRLRTDAAYRQKYLSQMERAFRAITENASGSVAFYLSFPEEYDLPGLLCNRYPENWGNKLPEFTRRDTTGDSNRYHVPQGKYLAKLSEPYRFGSRYLISYVVPLQKDDNFLGIVGLDIDFDFIIHEIKRMSVYENGFVVLLDKNGDVLYTNQPDRAMDAARGLYETEAYLSTGIWLKIAAYSHDIYADRNTMLIHFVVVMLFIVIAASILSVWLTKKDVRPMIVLSEAARQIAAGDLEVQLPPEPKNELGTLVASIREMVAKLETYVYRDKLTGLRNTAAYMRTVDHLIRREKSHGPQPYAVVVFDANFLKKINDTYGHEAGNELIRRAAQTICRVFAHSPVFRIGGDEFVAILEKHDYKKRTELLAAFDEQIADERFTVEDQTVQVSVARGMSTSAPDLEYSAVFQQADEAMYRHKAEIKARLGVVGR